MKIIICEFEGNFVSGCTDEEVASIDLAQSISGYQQRIEQALVDTNPEFEVRWDMRNGKGDPSRYHYVEFNFDYDNDDPSEEENIRFVIDAVREKVFSQGAFWVSA